MVDNKSGHIKIQEISHGTAKIAIAKLFYFCDYDALGFEFKLNHKILYDHIEKSLDPRFIKLLHKSFQEYTEQKQLFIEYLEYRVINLEYDENSKKDFENAVYYFRNIYFPRIENNI
ncbi:hypothetical protein GJV85_08625 [Sulfurimonas aquatica]|uniref:Uncharacterized protein n=1 Tax=Sulfurimonas aquatica TaxID=2672570 RepID=A0A975GDB2_9BACT|nr:hypothetical protein [Sulfurimonas aquatica]QSZ42173.1 hypothetical protein GJV85_08625 [Sulfurimonas aquatica]